MFHYLLRDYGLLDRIIQRAGPKTEISEVGCVLLCIGFLPRRNRRQKAMLKPKIGRLWEWNRLRSDVLSLVTEIDVIRDLDRPRQNELVTGIDLLASGESIL